MDNNLSLIESSRTLSFAKEKTNGMFRAIRNMREHPNLKDRMPNSLRAKIRDFFTEIQFLEREIDLMECDHTLIDYKALENLLAEVATMTKSANNILNEIRKFLTE